MIPPDPPPPISYTRELYRKALHLVALVIPIGLLLTSKPLALAFLVPAAVLAVCADVLRVRSVRFRAFIDLVFGPLMRSSELPPVGGPVVLNGATWVLVASAVVIALFRPDVAAAALAMFMIGDAAAALVGRRYGRRRFGRAGKSFEGAAGFVVAALPVALVVPYGPFWIGALGAVAAAVGEALPAPLNDNVQSPVLSGATMTLVLFLLS